MECIQKKMVVDMKVFFRALLKMERELRSS